MGVHTQTARVLFVLISLSFVSSLTFNVDPSKEECLFDEINMGVRVSGSFQVHKTTETPPVNHSDLCLASFAGFNRRIS